MEPAVETATLAVSYLWALRDLFPSHETIKTIDLSTLPAIVDDDIAVAVRLADIATRLPGEGWKGSTNARTEDLEFDDLLRQARDKRQKQSKSKKAQAPSATDAAGKDETQDPAARKGLASLIEAARAQGVETIKGVSAHIASGVKSVRADQTTSADLREVAATLVAPFAEGAKAVQEMFGDVRLRAGNGPPVVREQLARHVAESLLRNGQLRKLATELNYRPLLLRAIASHKDCVSEVVPLLRAIAAKDPLIAGRKDRDVDCQQAVIILLDDPAFPSVLIDACDRLEQPVPFPLVLHRELDEIAALRGARGIAATGEAEPSRQLATVRANACKLLGICFSGGGIRSATFNLGILQALANAEWLPHIDYLSTVSGGGYIGAWFLAWVKRRGSVASVQDSLRGFTLPTNAQDCDGLNPDPTSEHVRPIRLLREYSNYLAPATGLLSADTWTMLTIWLRNTSLNLLVMAFFLMGVLMLPRGLGRVLSHLVNPQFAWYGSAACFWWSSLLIGLNLATFNATGVDDRHRRLPWWLHVANSNHQRGDTALVILLTMALPAAVGSLLMTAALWMLPDPLPQDSLLTTQPFAWTTGIFSVGVSITSIVGFWSSTGQRGIRQAERHTAVSLSRRLLQMIQSAVCGALASAVGGVLMYRLWYDVVPLLKADTQRGLWLTIAFGPVAVLVVITVVLVVYLGLEGYDFPDERREWWSRLGAWFVLVGAAWLTVSTITFFGPLMLAMAGLYVASLGLSWATITGVGAKLASGGNSNGINLKLDKNPIASAVISLAPVMFIVGFLVLLAAIAHGIVYVAWAEQIIGDDASQFPPLPFDLGRYVDTYWATMYPRSFAIMLMGPVLMALSWVLAWRIDVNEFSMHHFYRNRLVRAYLGASRSRLHRRPNAFTGFDLDDDVKLWRFRSDDAPVPNDASSDCRAGYNGPYPIINATLNVTSGDDLAWQERKGQSFIFTPLYCGYDFESKQTAAADHAKSQFAYRTTARFVSVDGTQRMPADRDAGLGIGTTMAISGAAANPNAGYHSSPAVAFLMTVFNARLGWWLGNPRSRTWGRPSPKAGLFYLLSELFGFSDTRRQWVNLSDGGHFDNMGLYELVRRRCRFIVVCDGEEDETYAFDGLASAIRKCRVDFGVTIDLPIDALKPKGRLKRSRRHAAVGTISYPYQKECGTIVYVKASMTGDEPVDVMEYQKYHPEFPHQPTTDQFFDESQFESYRALGQHVGDELFRSAGPFGTGAARLDAVFRTIREHLTPAAGTATEKDANG